MSDPNELLARARALVALRDTTAWDEAADMLAETFNALDNWLTRGGFLPQEWLKYPRTRQVELDTVASQVAQAVRTAQRTSGLEPGGSCRQRVRRSGQNSGA